MSQSKGGGPIADVLLFLRQLALSSRADAWLVVAEV